MLDLIDYWHRVFHTVETFARVHVHGGDSSDIGVKKPVVYEDYGELKQS